MSYDVLPFDSDHFGYRIARLHRFAGASELEGAPVDCFYLTCSLSDRETVAALARPGYLLADIRVTLSHESAPDGGPLDSADERDRAVLRAMARTLHHDSRFYFDPHFDRERCDRLYDIWIDKSMNGDADAVLVVRRDAVAVGYITCHLDAPGQGRIGLVGVAEAARGAGMGSQLIGGALDWFRNRDVLAVQVLTQGRNVAAQRLYQKHGFRTSQVELFYHLWPQERQLV